MRDLLMNFENLENDFLLHKKNDTHKEFQLYQNYETSNLENQARND